MQSPSHSNTPSGEEEQLSDPEVPTGLEGFTITSTEASVLREYVKQFQDADTESWIKVIRIAVGTLYALRPQNSMFDKKEAMHVSMWMVFDSSCTNKEL
jgi:hypothetical protein